MRAFRFVMMSVLAVALASCATTGATSGGATRSRGSAPDFTLKSVDGRPTRLSSYLGDKVILMNFWATWCGPCTQELPHLEALHRKYKDQGLQVISIAMDGPESIANVAPFVRRTGLTFPVLLDEETRAVSLYNPTRGAPFNVFIDRNGNVAATKEGYSTGDDVVIENILRPLLAPAAAPESTSAPAPAAQ